MYHNEYRHWWFIARRRIIEKILNFYSNENGLGNILEIGCGSGGNLELLSTFGSVQAMEENDEAREFANTKEICHVKKGCLPKDIPFTDLFNIICLFDVLEHINNDLLALQTIEKKLLKRGGKLLITVPAFKILWSANDIVSNHKRRYSQDELIFLIRKANLKPIYFSYFNTLLFPFLVGTILLSKTLGKEGSIGYQIPLKPINTALTAIFSIERVFFPKISLPFGLSVLLVAEKAN